MLNKKHHCFLKDLCKNPICVKVGYSLKNVLLWGKILVQKLTKK